MLTHALASNHTVGGSAARPGHWPAASPQGLDQRLSQSPARTIEAKEHIFTEGDRRSHLYRVESGAVCLYKIMPDGRRQILSFAYPGDLFGLGSFDAHQLNAQATKPTRVRCLQWSTLRHVAQQDPALGLKLYEAISLELAAAQDLLLSTGQRSAMERVAAFLLAMSRRNARNGQDASTIDLPMTRADIGDFLGLTIEKVSRTFTKLREKGTIDLAQSARVRLLDIVGLREMAEGEAGT